MRDHVSSHIFCVENCSILVITELDIADVDHFCVIYVNCICTCCLLIYSCLRNNKDTKKNTNI